MGINRWSPLLQHSYCGGRRCGGGAAGTHCAGNGVGIAVHGKRHAGRYVELTG